jgi:hypothetical protein
MAFRRCNLMLGRNSIVSANMRKTKGFLSREGVNCCPPVIGLSISGTDSGLGRLGMIPTFRFFVKKIVIFVSQVIGRKLTI